MRILERMRARDLTGQTFGRLTALRLDGHIGVDRAWLCRCECGVEKRIRAASLTRGNSTSCGCLRIEHITSHGLHKSPEYAIWSAAYQRCHVVDSQGFSGYG